MFSNVHPTDVVDRSSAGPEILLARLQLSRDGGVSAEIRAAESDLVDRFRGFAAACARRFTGRDVEADDLVQIAEVGLLKAIRGWRPQPSGGFLQYAKPMIVGELKRYFRDQSPMIRIPRPLQEAGVALAMARRDLSVLGRQPTEKELATAAGLSVDQVRADATARASCEVESLDVGRNDSWCPSGSVVDVADAADVRMTLQAAIGTLNVSERDLLAMRFFKDLTQEQIGAVLGVSQMQVSRLLRTALGKLQHQMAA